MIVNDIIKRLPDGKAINEFVAYLRQQPENEVVAILEDLLKSELSCGGIVIGKVIPRVIKNKDILLYFLDYGLSQKKISGTEFWIKTTVGGLGYKKLLNHLVELSKKQPEWIIYAWYQLVPLVKKRSPNDVSLLVEIMVIVDEKVGQLSPDMKSFWERNKKSVPLS